MPSTKARPLEALNKVAIMKKVFALVQAMYLIVQPIARKMGGLPSAISALAIAAITDYLRTFLNLTSEVQS